MATSSVPNQANLDSPTPEVRAVDTLKAAALLAFAGGGLDAFLFLNHGQVYAGVMSGNAVLCALAVAGRGTHTALYYAWTLLAYVCGIWLCAVLQGRLKRHRVSIPLATVAAALLVASLLPKSFPERTYIYFVIAVTGFLVASIRKVDSYGYNATVLTGTLRDATISLYQSLNPLERFKNLREARDLWVVMLCFFAGVAADGVLCRPMGNHALWLPIVVILLVMIVALSGYRTALEPKGNN